MKRKNGFTIAEVLVTLGIIGVTAALTLPAMQSNIVANRNRATLKSTIALLSQVAQANSASFGWNFTQITDACDDPVEDNARENFSICGMMNTNLVGEVALGRLGVGVPQDDNYLVVRTLPNGGNNYVCYRLANGAIVGFDRNTRNCTEANNNTCIGFIDTNGAAGAHREITCDDGITKTYLSENPDRTLTCDVARGVSADIFPIRYHGNTVEVASVAARSFLRER